MKLKAFILAIVLIVFPVEAFSGLLNRTNPTATSTTVRYNVLNLESSSYTSRASYSMYGPISVMAADVSLPIISNSAIVGYSDVTSVAAFEANLAGQMNPPIDVKIGNVTKRYLGQLELARTSDTTWSLNVVVTFLWPDDPRYDNDCACGACCSDKCTCGKWSAPTCCGECTDICIGHFVGNTPCICHHDDNENGNQCTCGACCMHKCTCGNWTGLSCTGSCAHNCTLTHPHDSVQDCECHHTEPAEDGCCEHHKKDYIPPVLPPFDDPGHISVDMPVFGFTHPGVPDYGHPGMPGSPTPGKGMSGVVPNLVSASESNGGVEKKSLEYFERGEGKFDFPKFKYEEIYSELSDKYKEKFPLDWVDSLKDASGSDYELKWTVEFNFVNQHYGPWVFDVDKVIDDFADSSIAHIIRMVALAFVCIMFLIEVMGLVFYSS